MRYPLASIVLAIPLPFVAEFALAQSQPAGLMADELVRNFRALVLLHESESAKLPRARAAAGQFLFFQNRQMAARLVDGARTDPPACAALMDHMQTAVQWRDVDRLALGGVMSELEQRLAPDSPCLARVRVERKALASIRSFYNQELSAALGSSAAAAGPRRPEWTDYVAFLKRRSAADSGPAFADAEFVAPEAAEGVRAPAALRAERDEWSDGGLPAGAILLSFDDGPHPVYTPRVLDILARYRIKAVFFQIGRNLEPYAAKSAAPVNRPPSLIERMLAEGHSIANHTYTHPLLPRLADVAVSEELDRTESLLAALAGEHPGHARLFRPPYGARNDLVLADVSLRGLRSVIWNIDSRDWADPIPHSIAQRVVAESVREGRGIVLFHDIHLRSVEALEPTIEELIRRGFRFARLVEGRLVVDSE